MWLDNGCDAELGDFFTKTRSARDAAVTPLKDPGWPEFQDRAGACLRVGLIAHADAETIAEDLQRLALVCFSSPSGAR